MPADTDRDWEYFGRTDPYFGVLTLGDFQQQNLTEASIRVFFHSGQKHIDRVLSVVRSNFDPAFKPKRALDFGCGVGRLIIPLASVCDSVVGVDISESMLKEAQNNCKLKGVSNVRFVKSDDRLTGVFGQFDLIHSHIVFQHIPCKRGESVFQRLIELLDDGGIGVLHFTYCRKSGKAIRLAYWARKRLPLFNGFVNLLILRQPFNYPMMQMNEYDIGRLFCILQENDCHHAVVQFSKHLTTHMIIYGLVVFFQKKALPSW